MRLIALTEQHRLLLTIRRQPRFTQHCLNLPATPFRPQLSTRRRRGLGAVCFCSRPCIERLLSHCPRQHWLARRYDNVAAPPRYRTRFVSSHKVYRELHAAVSSLWLPEQLLFSAFRCYPYYFLLPVANVYGHWGFGLRRPEGLHYQLYIYSLNSAPIVAKFTGKLKDGPLGTLTPIEIPKPLWIISGGVNSIVFVASMALE